MLQKQLGCSVGVEGDADPQILHTSGHALELFLIYSAYIILLQNLHIAINCGLNYICDMLLFCLLGGVFGPIMESISYHRDQLWVSAVASPLRCSLTCLLVFISFTLCLDTNNKDIIAFLNYGILFEVMLLFENQTGLTQNEQNHR